MIHRQPRRATVVVLAAAVVLAGAVLALAGCASLVGSPDGLKFVGNLWVSGRSPDPAFLTYWNQITVENAGKWGNVERERDRMEWSELDRAYAYSREHGIPFRLHTLVWGRSQPAWLGRLSDEELRLEVEEWITLAGARYPDVELIDVVNEPFHALPAYEYALGGPGETGFDWIVTAFELAREHFPRAELALNEYGILRSESAARAYLRLVAILKERDLIDAIGVQAHRLEDVPTGTVRSNLAILAEAGLPIYITEFDLGITDDDEQARRMRELVTVFAENDQVRGITLWGYREGEIYLGSAYLLGADGTERSALRWLREFTAGAAPEAR
ncbi:MAG: endo-1,4-beta-xylanase [Spirochaetota bacterium]